MSDKDVLGTILEAQAKYGKAVVEDDEMSTSLHQVGEEMFNFYTQHGLPPDMFLQHFEKKVKLPKLAKVYILSIYQNAFLNHKRKSGIYANKLDKLRRLNREQMQRFITKNEIGIY